MADVIKVGGVPIKVYDDSNYRELIGVTMDGNKMGTGLIKRDPVLQPPPRPPTSS